MTITAAVLPVYHEAGVSQQSYLECHDHGIWTSIFATWHAGISQEAVPISEQGVCESLIDEVTNSATDISYEGERVKMLASEKDLCSSYLSSVPQCAQYRCDLSFNSLFIYRKVRVYGEISECFRHILP